MKIAFSLTNSVESNITSVTASSENASFPASNLILKQASKVWRSVAAAAPIATQTLTIVVPAGVNNALEIVGMNATQAVVTIKNTAEDTTYFGPTTFDLTPASPARTYNRFWMEWASNGNALHIIVVLTAPTTATYHEAGEVVVSETVTIPDPLRTGISQGRENCQTIQRLTGGGQYVHDGEKPRTFNLQWIMDRETEFDDLDRIYEVMGEKPVAMMISDLAANDMKWCGYFHMKSDPKADHSYPDKSIINLTLREAV